ncbi:sterol desaturase family protein [Erythrobacter sp. HL-111]|uniref:sterol desaturase family protein n=1 Tax=Erythrobacter sp. HL-111 TaxID=1798193 RepID=UPI0006DA60B7|nr:sterol desaturase family protein [Erythrobacter sp. HL-111]KPP88211.1 MAG: fatty acid hydroxylase superfamily [Erythrobacteraceae bacterium HL-111]SDS95885.1 Sterol desaturase/sphingolipid hydroxylase, fatty acid hydroxylase superfamily [Erythrobacter sp. HL-111]
MSGTRVGNRIIGAEAPVTVGWENIGRVEGGPLKQLVFTYFQPFFLFAVVAFWYWAPNEIAVASTAFMIAVGFKILLLALEWVNPRYDSWRLTWKEFATDLFYVGLGYTVLRMVDVYIGDTVMIEAIQGAFGWDKVAWFTTMPLLVQAIAISMIFDFGQYWMHRGMHNWYPLWLTHAPHHYITQLNINKGSVGNPVELFLIGLGIGGFFDFLPRAFLIAGAIGLTVATYQHINVRFNTPAWWRFIFNTTEHHSVHHSQDYEATRSNYSGTWILWDRLFGTCVDGEAEVLGMEGGRRMDIRETMHFPFTEGYRTLKSNLARRMARVAGPESHEPAE